MDNQQIERLLALWKSGRDKYRSFFAVLEEVRQEIGNDALPAWCRMNLQIGLSVITKARGLLTETDADIVKQTLAASLAAEKAQKLRDREQAALDRALAKEANTKIIIEAKAETEKARAMMEKAKGETDDVRETRKQKRKGKPRRLKFANDQVASGNLVDLAEAFKAAEMRCQAGLSDWIEGSVTMALTLFAARGKFPANHEFGAWCEASGISINADDRAALINLGRLGETVLREILTVSESHSYQHIWRRHNKQPELKIIEGG